MDSFENAASDSQRSEPPAQQESTPRVAKRDTKKRKKGLDIFLPDRMIDSVTEIPPEEFKIRGIKGLILDLDNTLVLWQEEEMSEEVIEWLQAIQNLGVKLCILSNSVLSKRAVRIAERLGVANVRKARKPATQGFIRAMQAMGSTPETTAIVGDQMFTDIWGGNRVGIYTIMVKPIHHREFLYTKYVSRPPERLLLRYFKRRGHL